MCHLCTHAAHWNFTKLDIHGEIEFISFEQHHVATILCKVNVFIIEELFGRITASPNKTIPFERSRVWTKLEYAASKTARIVCSGIPQLMHQINGGSHI